MAVYHLAIKVVSRARGQRIVALAAARSGTVLHDEHLGTTHNFSRKRGSIYSEIVPPVDSPAWVGDREALWNRVEAAEIRRDAQLAREVEVGLPMELTDAEKQALLRDYAQQFAAKGMVADISMSRERAHNPTGHLLLTLRSVTHEGFGPKERCWNTKSILQEWRSAWAHCANEHLARADHGVRIDHRTLAAQQIELIPARRIGVGRSTQNERGGDRPTLPAHVVDRVAQQQRIARQNGELIRMDPTVALRALTHSRPTFTLQDLTAFLTPRTSGTEQFEAVYVRVVSSAEIVALDSSAKHPEFTTRDMLEAHRSLLRRASVMAARRGHGVESPIREAILAGSSLSAERRDEYGYVVEEGDIKTLCGRIAAPDRQAGNSLGAILVAARRAWEAGGFHVIGAALSRKAVECLGMASGIEAKMLETCEVDWAAGRAALTRADVLVIAGAELLGVKQLERVLAMIEKAHAKVVLCGDFASLSAGGAGTAMHAIVGHLGVPAGSGV